MESIHSILSTLFENAILQAFPDLVDPPIVIALSGNNPKFGDYQCNSAMPISNNLKQQGIKSNPREVAQKIVNKVESNECVDKLEIAGAGFINIFLNKRYVLAQLQKTLKEGVKPPNVQKKLRVLVDFSSPNIAKEMHVGHLR